MFASASLQKTLFLSWDERHMRGPSLGRVKAPIVQFFSLPHSYDWLNTVIAFVVAFIVWRLAIAAITKFYARRFVSRVIPRVSTYASLTKSFAGAIVLILLTLELLNIWRINVAPALWSAGVIGVVLGFGAQAIVRDVLTGAFFLFEDVFDVGDGVELTTTNGLVAGVVEMVTLRQVQVVDDRGFLVTIPYGSIVFAANSTRRPLRMNVDFVVPLRDDVASLREQITKIAQSAVKQSGVQIEGLSVTLVEVSPSSATFRVAFEARRKEARAAAASLRELIAHDLQGAGLLPSNTDQQSTAGAARN